MRFGRNFPWHQLPKWADSYVNYDEWKFLTKAAKSNELKKALDRDTLVVKKFLDDHYDAVVQHLSILNDEYGMTLDSWHQEVLCSMPIYEKDDIAATLTDICSLLVCLSSYINVTRRAVERISTKSIDTHHEVEKLKEILQTAAARWVRGLQDINTVLRNIHLSKLSKEGSTSLLLSNLHSNKSSQTLEEAVRALQEDSTAKLEKCLQDEALQADNPSGHLALLALAKIAILCSSSRSLPFLVSRLSINHDFSRFASRNPLRLLVLHAARLKHQGLLDQDTQPYVRSVLDNLPLPQWSNILLCPDPLGRLALHYAAQHGMTTACREMVECLDSLHDSATTVNLPIFLIPDHLGETSLSIAITQGHDEILKLFLYRLRPSKEQASPPGVDKFKELFCDMVSLAIRSQHTYIAEILIDNEPRLVTPHSKLHDLLHLASQYGQASIAGRLSTRVDNINVGEPLKGRTPLMIASIYEHTDVVEVLLAHPSCDIGVRDYDGWTAVDHAAFKGSPALVKTLQGQRRYEVSMGWTGNAQRNDLSVHLPKSRNHASAAVELGPKRDRSHIFMNLGHFDMEKEPLILQVDPFRRLVAPMQIPDSSLTLEISAIDCETPKKYLVSFPIMEDLSNDPFYFVAEDPNAAKLLFRVYCSVLGRDNHLQKESHIGSAVVSFKDLRQGLGPSLESLERDHTVSLVSPDVFGSKYIGSFTFTFVIARPFIFQGLPPTPPQMVLKRDNSPLVAGHRGLGQNNAKQDRLQLGENTMDSFFAALHLGADILEFDVQVTRDLAPVVYHDFLVSEIGIDAPMHTVTYEQLMVPSTMQDSTVRPPGTSDSLLRTADVTKVQRPRASSEGKPRPDNVDVIARLKSTFNFHQFGFKGNIGGECIHGPFITLQQLLVQIDPSVCFDVELKYPMLFEARDFNMDTLSMELNLYLDTILAVVYKYGGSRPIFFSSFSPELCILLATKQQIYPVLFLTESGYIPTRDIRAISFQEAVRFAKKWNLEGVVIRSQPLVASPMLIGLTKRSGLVCASWGDLNNDPQCAKIQADANLDVIITDKVGDVIKVLDR